MSEAIQNERRIEDARKRLKLAKGRALYWSGNPSFTGKRFQPGRRGRKNRDLEYEMAMDDVENLCLDLEKLTGRPWKRYDPEAEFKKRYLALMAVTATAKHP